MGEFSEKIARKLVNLFAKVILRLFIWKHGVHSGLVFLSCSLLFFPLMEKLSI